MYNVILSDLASKQLKKLDKNLRIRIITVLKRCRIRPYDYVKRLVGEPYFSLRVGNYRIIMDISETNLRIFVIKMGHRKNIYN